MIRISAISQRDLKALRRLREGDLRRGGLGVWGVTMRRLVEMGLASKSAGEPLTYSITDDGARLLEGQDGTGPKHWKLEIGGLRACQRDIGHSVAAGCASSKKGEVERWAALLLAAVPGVTVEVVDGDCYHLAPGR